MHSTIVINIRNLTYVYFPVSAHYMGNFLNYPRAIYVSPCPHLVNWCWNIQEGIPHPIVSIRWKIWKICHIWHIRLYIYILQAIYGLHIAGVSRDTSHIDVFWIPTVLSIDISLFTSMQISFSLKPPIKPLRTKCITKRNCYMPINLCIGSHH